MMNVLSWLISPKNYDGCEMFCGIGILRLLCICCHPFKCCQTDKVACECEYLAEFQFLSEIVMLRSQHLLRTI